MPSNIIIPKDIGKGGSGLGFGSRASKSGQPLAKLKEALVDGLLADLTSLRAKWQLLLARLDTEAQLARQYVAGEAAVGTIVCVTAANIANGGTDHFHLGDGVHQVLEFYYDKNNSRTAGTNEVEITLAGAEDADAVRNATAAAIAAQKAAGKLDITETHLVAATVALTNDHLYSYANVPIVESVANGGFSVTGMAGGLDPLAADALTQSE